jgi:hypothetical protein
MMIVMTKIRIMAQAFSVMAMGGGWHTLFSSGSRQIGFEPPGQGIAWVIHSAG